MKNLKIFGNIFMKIIWIISVIFFLIFLILTKEDILYIIIFLIYISSIFLINNVRNKNRLKYFLFISDNLKNYFFPGFAFYSAILALLVFNTALYSPYLIIGWYFSAFLFINMIILIPTFYVLSKNINSIFARIYFLISLLIFGWGFSVLSGWLAGSSTIKNLNWLPITSDYHLFYILSYMELIISIFIIWYFFTRKRIK